MAIGFTGPDPRRKPLKQRDFSEAGLARKSDPAFGILEVGKAKQPP
jgi:hypothetical protein